MDPADAKRRELNGLIQIEAECRRPLPTLAAQALSCTSFRAMQIGMTPLHPITHQLHMIAVAQQIGAAA